MSDTHVNFRPFRAFKQVCCLVVIYMLSHSWLVLGAGILLIFEVEFK